jgi:hypothetical protein
VIFLTNEPLIDIKNTSITKVFTQQLLDTSMDLSVDYTEISLDSIITDELLKEIPIIKTIYSFGKAGFAVKETFFAKKILSFIREFQLVNLHDEKFNDFKEKILSDEKYRDKVSNHLIVIIDRFLTEQKSKILARLFKAYIEEYYDWDTFVDLSVSLDAMMTIDFKIIAYLYKQNREIRIEDFDLKVDLHLVFASVQRLRNSGFIAMRDLGIDDIDSERRERVSISDFGVMFYKNCLK